MNTKIVSILGCGWLGLPLGEFLVKNNFIVKGSTTAKEKFHLLEEKGIKPYQIIFDPNLQTDAIDFFDSEILILNIPPQRNAETISFTRMQVGSVIRQIKNNKIKKVIFISSTSVYGNTLGEVSEESLLNPDTASAKAVVESEKLLLNDDEFSVTILRFGGLIGIDRNPVKFFAGRNNIEGGNEPVNLIHLDDCINIIYKIIIEEEWNEVFNAVSPLHPTRSEFYVKSAEIKKLPLPHFLDNGDGKVVSPEKLIRKLNYSFIYPSPMDMI